MSLEKFGKTLAEFVPQESVPLLLELVKTNPFHLRITKPRSTKKGDFRPSRERGKNHRLSVNGDLNPYEFLVTLIHEYAHILTWDQYKNSVNPHGSEWKHNFSETLRPFIDLGCFPIEIKQALEKHLINPKASSCVDIELQKTLSLFDEGPQKITIEDIPDGAAFVYSKNRLFRKGERLRKRYKCQSLDNGRFYLFSPLAEVVLFEASLK